MSGADERFAALQARLHPLLTSPPGQERPLVVVPSFGFEPELLAAHAHDLPHLEERFLFLLFTLRMPRFRVLHLARRPPADGVLDDYLGLMPDVDASGRLAWSWLRRRR